jgi:hypothetical protein
MVLSQHLSIGTKKITKTLSQDIRLLGWDLNPRPPEAGTLTDVFRLCHVQIKPEINVYGWHESKHPAPDQINKNCLILFCLCSCQNRLHWKKKDTDETGQNRSTRRDCKKRTRVPTSLSFCPSHPGYHGSNEEEHKIKKNSDVSKTFTKHTTSSLTNYVVQCITMTIIYTHRCYLSCFSETRFSASFIALKVA